MKIKEFYYDGLRGMTHTSKFVTVLTTATDLVTFT
jgi:hypothetical protein